MADNKLDGQIDFLGLIQEYTDDQGATVRVKSPGSRKPKVKAEEPAQLKLDFIDLDAEFEAEQSKDVEEEQGKAAEEESVMTGSEPKPKRSKAKADKELLFKQCKRCWCYDCKHNSRNEAIPREMCGAMIPCPACNSCVIEEMATVCEIGNAEEGCKFRAIEEGIFVPETLED